MATTIDRPPPTTAAIAIATAIIAALGGFFLGQASSLGMFGNKQGTSTGGEKAGHVVDSDASESESDEEELQLQALQSFSGDEDECKLVLVVRTDLGMTKGKIAAQCSHATLACYKTLLNNPASSALLRRWERHGQAKVAVQVKDEDELELLQAKAMSLGICAMVVHDAGRTQIAAGSATVLGVGPAPKRKVDEVTGHLKLL